TKCLLFFGSLEKRGCEYSKERERNGSHAASVTSRWESFGGFKCFVHTWAGTGWHAEDNQQDGCPRHRGFMGRRCIDLQWPRLSLHFQRHWAFRDVDTKIAAAELSGQVQASLCALCEGTKMAFSRKVTTESGAAH